METTTDVQFIETYDECASKISGVCSHCGGKLEPIRTVDNSGNPTHWSGCNHCSIFNYGVEPIIFKIARQLVEKEGFVAYRHMDNPNYKKNATEEEKQYYLESQTGGACDTVRDVLRIYKELSGNQ